MRSVIRNPLTMLVTAAVIAMNPSTQIIGVRSELADDYRAKLQSLLY